MNKQKSKVTFGYKRFPPSKIKVNFNSLGMIMLECNCKKKGINALGNEDHLCYKCMERISAKLEEILG
jgi:hypothetical protein